MEFASESATMSDLVDLVNCPECGVKLRVKRGTERIKCSQCTKKFKRVLIDSTSRHPSEISSLRQSMAPPLPTESLGDEIHIRGGFFSFIWATYARTHSTLPRFFGFIFGFLLIPTLSFLKPLCGISTMISALGAAFGVFVISTMLLIAIASYRYLFLKQRKISPEHRSWLSATICFLGIIISSLAIVSIAEKFGPDDGLLVKLVPQFKKEQVRLLGDLATSTVSSSSESTDSDASDGFATTDSSADEVAAILSEDHSATVSDETAVTTHLDQINQGSNKSNGVEIADYGAEATSKSTKKLSSTTHENEGASGAKTESGFGEVIAEGVGATAEEALKDAYRNAVRQVVGAVVDAETLIENDELIEETILTYSDGFINDYEELAGSKKVKDGLHRIKIKAQVERRNVLAKLKAANVTIKEVDGKGLFAEAVTQLDAEKDAAVMLQKQFEGFPQSCITAVVVGEPKIIETNVDGAVVRFLVQVEPDVKAYKVFSARILPVLDKLATNKGDFTALFKRDARSKLPVFDAVNRVGVPCELMASWIPRAFDGAGSSFPRWKENTLTFAVASNRNSAGDRIEYTAYQLDPSLQYILAGLASRRGMGKLTLLDSNSDSVTTERFELAGGNGRGNDAAFAGTLMSAFGSPNGSRSDLYELGLTVYSQQQGTETESARKAACLFIASPTFFATRTNNLAHLPQLSIPIDLSLSLDELKSVKDAKVEITFDE